MNSSDIVGMILFGLIIIGIICISLYGIYVNHIHTEHYINEGYQQCYIMGHGTEWMKECNAQVIVEKR